MKRIIFIASALAITLSGCTTYKSASGTTYKNFLFRKQVASIELTDKDGSKLVVKGLKSDASEAFATINEAIKRYPVPTPAK
jgi:hypothetical protein